MHFQGFDVCALVDNQLQEELINRLQMWPGGVNQQLFILHSYPFPRQTLLFQNGQGPENVLFDHGDHLVQMGDDHG